VLIKLFAVHISASSWFMPILASSGMVVFLLSFRALRKRALASAITLFDQAQISIGAPSSSLPTTRSALTASREYLGLYWLQSQQSSVLIWPDQLNAEDQRLLRVWLSTQHL
jgi:predicted mannosyl-3-phosphoglycerate phosphatase (HAD superfamily)